MSSVKMWRLPQCNHGWEKQQTQRPKGSGPKWVRQAKKPTKRNPATGQKDHFKSIWLDKNLYT